MIRTRPYIWKPMPFARLIIPFIAGIILQFYSHVSMKYVAVAAMVPIVALVVYSLFNLSAQYKIRWLPGVAFNVLLLALGCFITYGQDIRTHAQWLGYHYSDSATLLVTLSEPLVEKTRSYKAEANVEAINTGNKWQNVQGKILVYFGKNETGKPTLDYGSQLLFKKPLQPITNSGNPGAFDYKQYCLFQGVAHQVYLKPADYVVSDKSNPNVFGRWLFTVRAKVLNTLRTSIKNEREAGVAEALLIGYRNDLDKDLVQAYSKTGVVHIIAISGLHLGLIYAVMVFLLRPFKRTRLINWARPVMILVVLWLFTLLAGAVPSIVRSAVMFTFIVVGEALSRKSNVYNTLASSAFVMLCINPYYLWDIGFLLSYAAVLSIVMFYTPIYNWFYLPNKALDKVWKLTAITLAAQVLTMPLIFNTFHQFPVYFLVANIFVVPLSSVILFAELALLVSSFLPLVASFIGYITEKALWIMNAFIEQIGKLPVAVVEGIQTPLNQTALLYVFIIAASYFLLNRYKPALFTALASLVLLSTTNFIDRVNVRAQNKLIVYNIPRHRAIDFIDGTAFSSLADTTLLNDEYLKNFHLKPARNLFRVKQKQQLNDLYISPPFVQYRGKKLLLLDNNYRFSVATGQRIPIDYVVISHNPRIYISDVARSFNCKQVIIDGSNSMWKTSKWKRDCDSLHLPCHVTTHDNAFIVDL